MVAWGKPRGGGVEFGEGPQILSWPETDARRRCGTGHASPSLFARRMEACAGLEPRGSAATGAAQKSLDGPWRTPARSGDVRVEHDLVAFHTKDHWGGW